MEVALNQLETQVETPLEKEVAISEVVKEEKRAALIRNAIIDVLEKSKSISPNEAVELRLGTASKELRDRARARVRSVMLHRRRRSPILPDHPLIKRPEQ